MYISLENDATVTETLTAWAYPSRPPVSEILETSASVFEIVSLPPSFIASQPASDLMPLRQALAAMSPELQANLRPAIAKQFGYLCDGVEGEDGKLVQKPDADSFAAFLRFIVERIPSRAPSMTLSNRGYVVASWFATDLGKFTIEFEPDGRMHYRYLRNDGGSISLQKGTLADTMAALPQNVRL